MPTSPIIPISPIGYRKHTDYTVLIFSIVLVGITSKKNPGVETSGNSKFLPMK